MSTKQKNIKKPSLNGSVEALQTEQRKERKMMSGILARERNTKWILIGIIVLLLLLMLFVGYATDWMRGVSKDSSLDAGDTSLDATKDSATDTGTGNADTTTNASEGTNTTTGTNRTNSTNTGSSTNRESTSTTTTTTTNNNPAPNPSPTPTPTVSTGLLDLYLNSSVGDDVSSILSNAQLLGLSQECHNAVLVQVCEFSDGNTTVTTKNLLGTGIITSITKNF